TAGEGRAVGVLCGIDHGQVAVPEVAVDALRDLAGVVSAHFANDDDLAIRRTPNGWRVHGADVSDLTSAMVLADLLDADLSPGRRPPANAPADETERLRLAVTQ